MRIKSLKEIEKLPENAFVGKTRTVPSRTIKDDLGHVLYTPQTETFNLTQSRRIVNAVKNIERLLA